MTTHNQPHKYRCETCENCEKATKHQRDHGQLPYCDEMDVSIDEQMEELIERLGCASHSYAIKAEQRIADVIAELEAKRADAKKNRNWERDRGYELALALLREKEE